jgi:CRP-like cAMP-binding protein
MVNMRPDSVLARKLNTFLPLSAGELKCLAEMQSAPVTVKKGAQLTQEGQTGHKAFVLQSGWACSFKDLRNGTRQIISFPIAGDCVGLRSVLLKTADHSFSALTDAVVSPVESTHIMQCVTEYPRLGAALLWAASRDEAMVVGHLVNIGRRSAIERTAHFFMELAERLLGRPRRQIAITSASVTSSAVIAAPIDQPTTLSENRSMTAATYSQLSHVQM